MSNTIGDLSGKRFGHLTAIKRVPSKDSHVHWLCRCDCGQECETTASKLYHGNKTHCGCRRGEKRITHGGAVAGKHHPLYSRWSNMRQRCENPKHPNYAIYGGRGIYVCDEWHDFGRFRDDLIALGYDHNKPTMEQQMDRIDNDGPYAPWNIRLVGHKIQANNRRNIPHKGPRKAVEAIASDGSVIARFDSVTSASFWVGKSYTASAISGVLHGRYKSAYGYKWRYAE